MSERGVLEGERKRREGREGREKRIEVQRREEKRKREERDWGTGGERGKGRFS